MLVVKTTSPATSPSPAKLQPSNAAPSSRTSAALLRTYSKTRSSSVVYRLATNYSTHDPARQRPPEIRRIERATDECLAPDRPLLREVEECQISLRADGQAPSLTDPPAWGAAHRFDEPRQREPPGKDKICVERGERRLVAEESGRGLFHR